MKKNDGKTQKLGKVCDELFYQKGGGFAGNVGIKNLGKMLEMDEDEFDKFFN